MNTAAQKPAVNSLVGLARAVFRVFGAMGEAEGATTVDGDGGFTFVLDLKVR
jgi:hypothetical protein